MPPMADAAHFRPCRFPFVVFDWDGTLADSTTIIAEALQKQGLKRMFLHAHRIRFTHPVDGREVVVEAPLAPDLAAFVARLDAADG